MATINGKSLKEIIQELQADFPKSAIKTRDYDGVKYIGVDDYRERLDNVVGVDHYNEKYDPVELVKAQDSYATKTRCTLELLDDDYTVILTKESSGGSNIAFPKVDSGRVDEKGKTIKEAGTVTNSLPNDFDSACQDAFKRICRKQFHMGERQLEEAKAGTLYIMKLLKDCTLSSTGHIFSNGIIEGDGKTYNFVAFKNTAAIFQESFGLPKKGDIIHFYGKSGNDKNGNPQLIFEKPGKKPESKKPEPEPQNTTPDDAAKNNVSEHIEAPDQNPNVFQQRHSKMLFKSVTVMKEIDNYPGCYAMKANNKDGEQILYFLKDKIDTLSPGVWDKWINESSKKTGINFTISVLEKNGKFYFVDFA